MLSRPTAGQVETIETGAWHCSPLQEYSLKGLWDAVPMVITFVGAVSFLGVCLAIGIFKYALMLCHRSYSLLCVSMHLPACLHSRSVSVQLCLLWPAERKQLLSRSHQYLRL